MMARFGGSVVPDRTECDDPDGGAPIEGRTTEGVT
jgi:hypothetical protein